MADRVYICICYVIVEKFQCCLATFVTFNKVLRLSHDSLKRNFSMDHLPFMVLYFRLYGDGC